MPQDDDDKLDLFKRAVPPAEAVTDPDDLDLFNRRVGDPEQGPRITPRFRQEESPLDFWTRTALSIKITPQGKVGFLKSLPAVVDARINKSGDTEVKLRADIDKGLDDRWHKTDMGSIELGDIADMGGVLIEALPEFITGYVTANPWAATAAGAVGSAARQVASEMLPGEEDLSGLERAGMVGTNAALAGGSQKLVNTVLPQTRLARAAIDDPSEVARAGKGFSLDSGIDLSVAETTLKRSHQLTEASLSQNIYVGDEFARHAQRQSMQAYTKIKSMMDDLVSPQAMGGGQVDTDWIGDRAIRVLDDAITGLKQARSTQGAADVVALNRLVGRSTSGQYSKRIFGLDNFRNTAQKWIDELDVVYAAPESKVIVKQLEEILTKNPDPGKVSGEEMIRLLSSWSRRSTFTTEEKATAARVARELAEALDQDMLDAAAQYADNIPIQKAVATLRQNWRRGSEAIRAAEKLPASKLLGEGLENIDPDLVIDKMLKMKPTSLKRTIKLMRTADPDVVSDIKAAWLQRVLDHASDTTADMENMIDPMKPISGLFSKQKAMTYMKRHHAWSEAIFSGAELRDIEATIGALQRAASNPYAKGSRTAPLQLATQALQGLSITGIPKALWDSGTIWLGHRELGRAMLTYGGRNALRTVATAKEFTHPVVTSLLYLGALSGQEQSRKAGNAPSVGQSAVQQIIPAARNMVESARSQVSQEQGNLERYMALASQPRIGSPNFMADVAQQPEARPTVDMDEQQRRIQMFMQGRLGGM